MADKAAEAAKTGTNRQAAVAVSGEESYVNKLTIKNLGCIPAMVKTLPPEQTKMAIARFYGKANDIGSGQDKDKGIPFYFFKGSFEGINLQDGTVLRSGKLFLPPGIHEVLEAALKSGKEKDKDATVSFAFEIRAVKATNPIGYSYEAAALKKPEQEDELAEMRAFVAGLPTHEEKLLKGGQVKQIEGQTAQRKSA